MQWTGPRARLWLETWRRLRENRGAVVGLGIAATYVAIALLADVIAPNDPTLGDLAQRLHPPSPEHWLGSDELGRDILGRIIHGARISLEIQVGVIILADVVGVVWGLLAGYIGGWLDDISMRVVDVIQAFPSVLFAIGIVAVLGVSLPNLILAIAIGSVPGLARLVRGVVLGLREMEFVEAARAVGESNASIMFRYLLPSTLPTVIVQTSLRMATVLLTASGLSFLGLGVPAPTPEWGAMLANARDYVFFAPHVTTAPGLAITIVVVGFNLLGDGLRDALDPRMRT